MGGMATQSSYKEWRAYEQRNTEFRKQERYCKEQREVLRALEELKEQERTMFELDNRKDQVMNPVVKSSVTVPVGRPGTRHLLTMDVA